ncbi:MAG: DEAD/DEAH box helicase [Halobacteriovoraceae bacterium]|nr:DEAD/DEAH box helicase [Halobacteriovoraceae bacterium]|tara:strand:+ start:6740 stop:8005 length:1266 start_codon:yes stop_codon:yes gene_type:complete
MITFNELNLQPQIHEAIKMKGYENPTPIQAQAIPELLVGKDLLGIAQTGSGKTAAFSLPIINHLALNPKKLEAKSPRVLILTPTRELATQIDGSIKTYSQGMNLRTKVIFGGVGATPQVNALRSGLDIVVATPGRLVDLMGSKDIKLDQVEIFVLDEADRMLDMGFIHDVKKMIARLPKNKQTLLFSATMPRDIEDLAKGLLKNPKKVEVTPESTTVEKITQTMNYLKKDNKVALLTKIIQEQDITSALVFTRTKHGADRVVRMLEKESIKAAAIHGNKSQNNRERALRKFREGEIKILVATDIAARGIDVSHISHVINYNLPEDPKSYVHRIGRTARAGREGFAISFCDEQEMNHVHTIEKHIRKKITVDTEQPFHEELTFSPRPVRGRDGRRGKGKAKAKPKKKLSMSKKARRRRSFKG